MATEKTSFMLERVGHLADLENWPNAAMPITGLVTEFIPETCKIPYDYIYRDDPVAMAETTLLVQEYIDFDLVIANLDIYNFEAENMGQKLRFFKNACPDVDRENCFIRGPEDLDKVKFQGMDAGRMRYLVDFCRAWERFTGVSVAASQLTFSAPWTLACDIMGLENLVMAVLEDPDFVHELMKRIVRDVHLPMFTALKAEFPEFATVMLADAFGTPPMITPDIAEEFMQPYIDMENELMAPLGIAVMSTAYFGISQFEGDERRRYEEFIAHVNQAYYFCDPDTNRLGAEFGRKRANELGVLLHTGIAATFVENSTPEEIVERTKDYCLKAHHDALTPAFFWIVCVTTRCPIENVMTATHAARIYGAPGATIDTPYTEPEYPTFEEFLKYKIANNVEGYTFEWLKHSGYSYLLKQNSR